jgi:cardiolipin synthase
MKCKSLALVLLSFCFASSFALGAPVAGKKELPKQEKLPGFFLQDYTEVRAGSSPDNSYSILTETIHSTQNEIFLAAYMLRSPGICAALEDALQRGVKVEILLDGWTVGRPKAQKIDDQELYFANRLFAAGAKILYLKSDTGPRDDRRFRYIHAKYAILDSTVFISSENLANSGFSPNGTLGSRGWVIAVKNETLAKHYIRIFKKDSSPLKGLEDLCEYGCNADYQVRDPNYVPSQSEKQGTYLPRRDSVVRGVMGLERAMSPDDSTDSQRAVLKAIDGAEQTIDIQSLSFAPHWGTNLDTPETNPSPYAESVLNAARRGVKVRVMLNPEFIFFKSKPAPEEKDDSQKTEIWHDIIASMGELQLWQLPQLSPMADNAQKPEKPVDTKSNSALIKYFREVAKKESLDIQVHNFFVTEDGIRLLHNKGMVVDNKVTLVSSMNWTENSIRNNREAGIMVSDSSVADHYSRLFDTDWKYFRNKK